VPARLFTPAEANSALPDVRPLAERLSSLRSRLRELEQVQRTLVTAIGGNGGGRAATGFGEAQSEFAVLAVELEECIAGLDRIGVQVKDADSGLLDFPARRAGRDVLLCWRLGEDVVAYWHGLDEGFAGRKQIDWDE
jgi:hypothetical protein